MMIRILLPVLLVAAAGCNGQTRNATPSIVDRFNSALENAAKKSGAVKDYGPVRKIKKGAQPQIILRDGVVSYDGKPLVLRRRIEEWRKIIGHGAVCSPANERPSWCKWDDLGIEITGSLGQPAQVVEMNLRLSRDTDEHTYDLRPHDAQGKPVVPIWLSKGVFPGYFEFDGFGIDKHTRFWEIRGSVSRRHNLRCGLRDCHQPHGAFGPEANVYMVLNRDDEYGEVREFTITSASERDR